jgi:stage II sporulation protein D
MTSPYPTAIKRSLSWLRRAGRVAVAQTLGSLVRRAGWVGVALAALLIGAGPVAAATMFYVRGGGDGHRIGMSQYGSYGFALHGKDYRWILGHYYTGTSLGTTDPNRTIRVLLAAGAAAFGGATSAPGKKLNPNATYRVVSLRSGAVAIVNPRGKTVGAFAAPLTVTGDGPLWVPGLGWYRGALQFRPDGAGGIETVNALDLEDYVRGVISAEMPSGWAPEALKVQAVAARTYAITTTVNRGAFDVYSDTRSQMYRGMAAETASTNAAVAATHGQIVTYNGAPAITYFAASSGGYTEDIQDAWPGSSPEPWLKAVPDPYDNAGGNPYYRWTYSYSLPAVQAKLGRLVKGKLIGIQIIRDGADPGMVAANVVGTAGTTRVSAGSLEGLFGLLSTNASFSTITTLPGAGAVAQSARAAKPAPADHAVAALVPLVHDLVASMPSIHGTVFPGHTGDSVTVQIDDHGTWKDVATTTLGAGGSYSAQIPGAGTYRIVYADIDGPSVSVS